MILTNTRKPKPQLELVPTPDGLADRVYARNGELVAKLAECRANGFDVLTMIVDRPSGYWLVVRKQSVPQTQQDL